MGEVFQTSSSAEDTTLHNLEMHCVTLVLARVKLDIEGMEELELCSSRSWGSILAEHNQVKLVWREMESLGGRVGN